MRLPRLIQTLPIAKGECNYLKLLKQLTRFDVLLVDDWGWMSNHTHTAFASPAATPRTYKFHQESPDNQVFCRH